MGINVDIVFPSHTNKEGLSQLFNFNFSNKIITIRTALQADLSDEGFFVRSLVNNNCQGYNNVNLTTVEGITRKVRNSVNMILCRCSY